MASHGQDLIASTLSGLVDALRRPIPQGVTLHVVPQCIHRVQLGRCPRQQPDFDTQAAGPVHTLGCCMLRSPIFEQYDIPTAPVRPNLRQELSRSHLIPVSAYPQRNLARSDVDRPVQDPSLVAATYRHGHLLTNPPIAAIQRWRFRDDGFIEHQQDRPHVVSEAVF